MMTKVRSGGSFQVLPTHGWWAWSACVALLLVLLSPGVATAHAGSKSYLTFNINGDRLDGQLVMSVTDMALALKLDVRQSPQVLRAALGERSEEVRAYAQQGLLMLVNGRKTLLNFDKLVEARQNGEDFVILELRAQAPSRIDRLDVGYMLFFEDDTQHECLARVEWDGGASAEVVFGYGAPYQRLDRTGGAAPGFVQFVRSGVWHIWTGYDHCLFLIALLLPAVFERGRRAWEPVSTVTVAIMRVLAIVTAFTIAHSITLTCAVMGWVELPARFVESAIAASVFIAALLNFLPATAGFSGPGLAFAFGLLHGFGFASVLRELVPDSGQIWRPLVAFNIGVELGQLAIVAVFFSAAWTLRGTRFYRVGVMQGGSAAVCACAAVWFCLRVA
jgi:hypothetical protein